MRTRIEHARRRPRRARRVGSGRDALRLVGLAVLLATVPATAGAAPPASRCSLVPTLTSSPFANPDAVAFLGRAAADTVPAGAGTVRAESGMGHFGHARGDGPVHGQVVLVERLAPRLPAHVDAALRAAGDRVVLVPWDYGPDCRPVRWGRSARWLPVGVHGLYQAALRDSAHWAGGVPTLDVFAPQFVPYTGTARDREGIAREGGRAYGSSLMLTPGQLLALRATLPGDEAVAADPEGAFAALRAWAAAHAELAALEPARTLLRAAEATVEASRFRQRPVPLAGTYRVTVWLAGDSTTFHARTEDSPITPLSGGGAIVGMYVLACAAATEAALPTVRHPAGCAQSSAGAAAPLTEGYLAFGDDARASGPRRTERPGSVDVVHGDSAFVARYAALRMDLLRRRTDDGPRRFLAGRFTEGPDGAVTFAWTIGPPEAPLLRVTAVRVSTRVLGERAAGPP